MGTPDYVTCLLRNLYACQEATVRTGHVTTDWLQMGKGVCQGCILSACLFNLYAPYVMWHTGLDEAQIGIKISGRNIHNLRYTDDTTLRQWTDSKLGKEYIKAVHCQPAHLIYMHGTYCDILGWMKHKLESRFQGEISIISDIQMTPPLDNGLIPNWERSTSRLYIVSLLI